MDRPIVLRVYARDPCGVRRVCAFYARVFGWSLPDDGHRRCWVISGTDDSRLGLDGGGDVVTAGVPTVHVADLDATTAIAVAAGGEVLVARVPLPGAGWVAYLADPEGNLLGVMQDDPSAAWPRQLVPAAPDAAATDQRAWPRRGREPPPDM